VETPIIASAVSERSVNPPARAAPTTPSAIPATIQMIPAPIASDSVAGSPDHRADDGDERADRHGPAEDVGDDAVEQHHGARARDAETDPEHESHGFRQKTAR
jgi:hypothetical protein